MTNGFYEGYIKHLKDFYWKSAQVFSEKVNLTRTGYESNENLDSTKKNVCNGVRF